MMMLASICSFSGFTFFQFIYNDHVESFSLSTVPSVCISLFSGLIVASYNPALGLLLEGKSLAIGVSIGKFVACTAAVLYPILFSYVNTKDGEESYGSTSFWLMVASSFGVIMCVSVYMLDIHGEQILERPYKEVSVEEKSLEGETKLVSEGTQTCQNEQN